MANATVAGTFRFKGFSLDTLEIMGVRSGRESEPNVQLPLLDHPTSFAVDSGDVRWIRSHLRPFEVLSSKIVETRKRRQPGERLCTNIHLYIENLDVPDRRQIKIDKTEVFRLPLDTQA